MRTDFLEFNDTGYFSKLIGDYLNESKDIECLYGRHPKVENFKAQIKEKQKAFTIDSREILSKSLKEQYANYKITNTTKQNIEALKAESTFTITTGHQLNLFTGPLYFLYKIISTINLARTLKTHYPEFNFVPVYWMATEDHDFEEINYFNFKSKKIQWNRQASGAVGELSTEGLEAVFDVFSAELGMGKNADDLKALFKASYLNHETLADATRYIANQLFGEYGLIIIDANDKGLKKLFAPFAEKELIEQQSFKKVTETNKKIESISNYTIQVNPRLINLFYNTKNRRERIVFQDDTFKVVNTKITWSIAEVKKELEEYPERFSPNVILRPLYQEVILPNLCYIGGGGELAYWFQLKSNFEANAIPFPILLLRNSVLIKNQYQSEKLEKLNISNDELFLNKEQLTSKKTKELSAIPIDFSTQKMHLSKQFEELYILAKQTDKSFLGAVGAQERKQIKGLEYLEKRLLKAQKRKLSEVLNRITILQKELFPNQSLQERTINFSELYLEFGEQLIPKLIKELDPLQGQFAIVTL